MAVTSLQLDPKNPRLGRETSTRAPREIIQYLFEHDKALEIARSIAVRGYFPNEPVLAIQEGGRTVVVEGNRRLAALKALKEPGLLEGRFRRQVERFAQLMGRENIPARVPVTIAPSRRSTDKQIAGRHVGTPVLPWQAENRASFILEKLAEGYTNESLRSELDFTLADIQKARQTRAIADMARSLDLPEEVKAKLDKPRAAVFSTIERVIESSVGREYLKIEPDAEHGLRGTTTKAEFIRGFTQLVSDVALGKASSRKLNESSDIRTYFEAWPKGMLPSTKKGTFIPADVISGKSVASRKETAPPSTKPKKSRAVSETVLPKDFKVLFGTDRLVEIRKELTRLKRDDFPNAGAVLLRVFLELSILDFLHRTGDLASLISTLESKGKLRQGIPTMKDLRVEIVRVAKKRLSAADGIRVEKAIRSDPSAPFGLDDLHSFVHGSSDLPGSSDIQQFWLRTEPLFRLMLERPV